MNLSLPEPSPIFKRFSLILFKPRTLKRGKRCKAIGIFVLMAMTDKEAKNRYQVWKKRLKRLRNEVSQMLIARHVFWKVQDIIRDNPRIQRGNLFYKWLGDAYVTDMLIKIRRQGAPTQPDDISFSQLLKEISESPQVLSWKRFKNLYRGSAVKDFARRDFERNFGWKGSVKHQHINPAMVRRDHRQLNVLIKKLKWFIDKRIAHLSIKKTRRKIRFDDLKPALDFLEKLVIKYELILNAANYGSSIFPSGGKDWIEVFREPWIPAGESLDRYRF